MKLSLNEFIQFFQTINKSKAFFRSNGTLIIENQIKPEEIFRRSNHQTTCKNSKHRPLFLLLWALLIE